MADIDFVPDEQKIDFKPDPAPINFKPDTPVPINFKPDTPPVEFKPDVKPQPTKVVSHPEPGLLQKMKDRLPQSSLYDEIKDPLNWMGPIGQGIKAGKVMLSGARSLIESHMPEIIAEGQGKPGIMNPDPQKNPLINKSFLPETQADPGVWGAVKHFGYEQLRNIASPFGAYSTLIGSHPPEESGLMEAGLVTKPKPRFKILANGNFQNLEDGTILDKQGNIVPSTPEGKLEAKLNTSRTKNVEQADIYRQERAQKFGIARDIAEGQTKPEGAAQTADKMLASLSGEHTKVQIEPLKLEPGEMDQLYHTVESHPRFETTDKIHAITGLKKLENGDVPQDNEIDAISKFFGFKIPDADNPNRVFNIMNKLSSLSGKMTRMVLGFHIPGTAYGFHGLNEGIRNTIYGPDFNPLNTLGRGLESAYYLARPTKANAYLDMNPDLLDVALRDGLRVNTPDVPMDSLFKGSNFLTKGLNYLTDPKPLFQQVIPALKLKAYDAYKQQMIGWGVEEKMAGRMAAYNANNQFGGVNLNGLMASESNRNLARVALLAPDWMASNYRLGRGIVQSLANPSTPQGRMYRVGIANLLGSYTALNVLNAFSNDGRFMWQNDVGHEMDVAYGKDDKGRVRYFSPYGTAMDAIRLPMGIVHAAATGQVGQAFFDARSRLSEPLQMITDLITNTDYAGRPLYDKTKYGKPISIGKSGLQISTDMLDHIAPVGAQALTDYAEGKISEEELVTKLLQLPMRYKLPPKGGQ